MHTRVVERNTVSLLPHLTTTLNISYHINRCGRASHPWNVWLRLHRLRVRRAATSLSHRPVGARPVGRVHLPFTTHRPRADHTHITLSYCSSPTTRPFPPLPSFCYASCGGGDQGGGGNNLGPCGDGTSSGCCNDAGHPQAADDYNGQKNCVCPKGRSG